MTPPPQFDSPVCATVDPEAWFPITSRWGHANRAAAALCRTCPHQQPCLDYALTVRVDGIWGGLSAEQREPLMSRNAAAA